MTYIALVHYSKIDIVLEDPLNTTFYLWNNLTQQFHVDEFEIKFRVFVCGEHKEERSPGSETIVTHLELHKQFFASHVKINLTVSCGDVDVIANWTVMNEQRVDDIDGYCVQYQCDSTQQNQTVSNAHIHIHCCSCKMWPF